MRAAPGMLLIAAVYLAGCRSEPTFDERYGAAEDKIRSKAANIESELSATDPKRTPEGTASDPVRERPNSPRKVE